jgi:hypothetical protein
MADTVELFINGLPFDDAGALVQECTGLEGEVDDYGDLVYTHPSFIASLSAHTYVDEDDLDFSSYPYELSAKNYWDPSRSEGEESETVLWFRQLFSCLKQRGEVGLLLTYNLDYALDRFNPGSG